MLIRETDMDTLFLLQAAPRAWFEDGKSIEIERAPTCFGPLSLTTTSEAKSGQLRVAVDVPGRHRPKTLLVRLRHPQGNTLRSVQVNGAEWTDFNPGKEWVRITNPEAKRYDIEGRY